MPTPPTIHKPTPTHTHKHTQKQILDLWDQDLNGFIAKLARLPLLTQPGTEWRYSVGFDVLGAVIERVAKMPLDAFMKVGMEVLYVCVYL